MKKIAKNMMIVLLSLIVFITTSGFSIFKHHCNHMNNNQNSIFLEYNCCHKFTLGARFAQQGHNELTIDKEGCCKTHSSFLKNENPFQLSVVQQLEVPQDFEIILLNCEETLLELSTYNVDFNYDINGPPLIDKQFLFMVHQLKLAPPSC